MVEYSWEERDVKINLALNYRVFQLRLGAIKFDFVNKHAIIIPSGTDFIELELVTALISKNSKHYQSGGCGVGNLCRN